MLNHNKNNNGHFMYKMRLLLASNEQPAGLRVAFVCLHQVVTSIL
jgi:hypothetical protein